MRRRSRQRLMPPTTDKDPLSELKCDERPRQGVCTPLPFSAIGVFAAARSPMQKWHADQVVLFKPICRTKDVRSVVVPRPGASFLAKSARGTCASNPTCFNRHGVALRRLQSGRICRQQETSVRGCQGPPPAHERHASRTLQSGCARRRQESCVR